MVREVARPVARMRMINALRAALQEIAKAEICEMDGGCIAPCLADLARAALVPRSDMSDPCPHCGVASDVGMHAAGCPELLEQERNEALVHLSMREAECEWLRKVEAAAREVVEAVSEYPGAIYEPVLSAAQRLRAALEAVFTSDP